MAGVCRIAILGATGHVGSCLLAGLGSDPRFRVTAVVRSAEKLQALRERMPGAEFADNGFDSFARDEYDAIVNCVGVGTPTAVAQLGASIFDLTARFDALCLDYVAGSPATRYIDFSSGAAYGRDFSEPVSEGSVARIPVNAVETSDFYGIAKLAAEAGHRAASQYAIVDLRLFGLFSRWADLGAGYLLTDIASAILAGSEIEVGADEMVRDYVAPADLAALVASVALGAPRNDVFDVYSAGPVSKSEILAAFAQRYELDYRVRGDRVSVDATGPKANYYSLNTRARELGYEPSRTSLQALIEEMDALIAERGLEL